MAKAKITLIGFYNYMQSVNDDLFSKLHTPTGIDKSILVNNILLKGGEFEVLYAEPYFMQNMIGVWSDKWQHTMERWINALSIDYNPLENYDRMEDWTDDSSKVALTTQDETMTNNSNIIGMQSATNSNNESKTNEHSDNEIKSNEHSDNEETQRNENAIAEDYSASSGSGVTENERSSFDASTYQKHDKSTSTTNGENVSSGLTSADGTTETSSNGSSNDITMANGSASDETSATGSQNAINQNIASGDENKNTKSNAIDNSSSVHQGRTHGNIGVTTSQQMLEAELDIAKWNLYDEIADLFLSELVIYLY